MRIALPRVVATLAVLTTGLFLAAESVVETRFPTTDLAIEAINARGPLANTAAAFARAGAGEIVPFRVLFYGQSITASGWPDKAMERLQARHSNIAFQWENRAIGGFSARRLARAAPADLADLAPDLIVFRVRGDHRDYAEIVETMLRTTSADIILQTYHATPSDWPAPPCPTGLTVWPWHGAHCTGWPAVREKNWSDYMSYHFIPALAERHGLAVHDVRRAWPERLAAEGLAPQEVLTDHTHLDALGERIKADLFVEFLEDAVAAPRHATMPLPAPGADGTVTLSVDARRVEAVSRTPLEGVSVTIDGAPAAAFAGCVAHGRPSRAVPGLVWPATRRVGADATLVAETWTARLHDFSEDFSDFSFSVTGSVTGPDGSGRASEDFRSESGRVLLDASDWMTSQVAAFTGAPLPDPLEVTWRARFLCDDVAEVPVQDGAPILITTLATGLEGPTTLRLAFPGGGAEDIEHLRLVPARLP
jgi:hypothetical protein